MFLSHSRFNIDHYALPGLNLYDKEKVLKDIKNHDGKIMSKFLPVTERKIFNQPDSLGKSTNGSSTPLSGWRLLNSGKDGKLTAQQRLKMGQVKKTRVGYSTYESEWITLSQSDRERLLAQDSTKSMSRDQVLEMARLHCPSDIDIEQMINFYSSFIQPLPMSHWYFAVAGQNRERYVTTHVLASLAAPASTFYWNFRMVRDNGNLALHRAYSSSRR